MEYELAKELKDAGFPFKDYVERSVFEEHEGCLVYKNEQFTLANIAIGYVVFVLGIMIIFPLFGVDVPLKQNLALSTYLICASFARTYTIRRLFNRKYNCDIL